MKMEQQLEQKEKQMQKQEARFDVEIEELKAENEEFEVKPYLHVLPSACTSFKNLWQCVGVEKKFTMNQFQTVLKELHTLHGNNPLPKADLTICLTILSRGLYEAEEKNTSDCLIPNEDGVLQHASKLYFNDSPWMPVAEGVTLCHKEIPRVMALYFGIKTTRHQTLQNHRLTPTGLYQK